jgi:hypothetical protein
LASETEFGAHRSILRLALISSEYGAENPKRGNEMALAPQPSSAEWHLTETYKGLITLSIEALKMLALVNGGAAVAVLTYLGNLASHSPAPTHLPDIKPALLWYCMGLVGTVVAFIAAYLTQLRLYVEEVARGGGTQARRLHGTGIGFSCVLALSAAVAFGLGCWNAAEALAP